LLFLSSRDHGTFLRRPRLDRRDEELSTQQSSKDDCVSTDGRMIAPPFQLNTFEGLSRSISVVSVLRMIAVLELEEPGASDYRTIRTSEELLLSCFCLSHPLIPHFTLYRPANNAALALLLLLLLLFIVVVPLFYASCERRQ
jgi:hypothetical protein